MTAPEKRNFPGYTWVIAGGREAEGTRAGSAFMVATSRNSPLKPAAGKSSRLWRTVFDINGPSHHKINGQAGFQNVGIIRAALSDPSPALDHPLICADAPLYARGEICENSPTIKSGAA